MQLSSRSQALSIVYLTCLSVITAASAASSPLKQAFRDGTIFYSTGGKAVCVNGVVPISASAKNFVLDLPSPATQFDVTEIIQELFQADSTIAKRVQKGTRTVQGTYGIGANFCVPRNSTKIDAVKTVQILSHGIGLEKSYWDIAPGYSHVDAAAEAGYGTFAYDRLGVGQSDHPDAIQDVQAFLEVEILHGLAQLLRNNKFGGFDFTTIVGIGHSFGSIIQHGANVKYPQDFDGAVLTGFSVTTTYFPDTILANNPSIAALNQPERFGNLSYGYLVHNDAISIQQPFFRYPFFDPAIFQNQVDRKDTYTLGEDFTIGELLKPAPNYTGPVDVVTGQYDFPNCLGNCSFPDNQLAKVVPALYPKADRAKSELFLVPENGHIINAHRSAGKAFDQIN
ncbi:MAG: hypothetical protein Q9168_006019, partial [Polycauliona sp. 1 TL-2023]